MILYFLSVLVILIAPAITGVFWGAPLIARELEAGTSGWPGTRASPGLAPPVVRDRDVPGPRPGPRRVLLLAAQPPPILTNSTSVALEGIWSGGR
jgi:hypothetical protein